MEVTQLNQLIASLQQAGYPWLGWLLQHQTASGRPFLVIAARYFFRREVESDRELFQGLTFEQLYQLNEDQQAVFQHLSTLSKKLGRHRRKARREASGFVRPDQRSAQRSWDG